MTWIGIQSPDECSILEIEIGKHHFLHSSPTHSTTANQAQIENNIKVSLPKSAWVL